MSETTRERDLDRLLTFVDAIVAIAITLLVLPLAELVNELGPDEDVADLLGDHQGELWAFLLSFYVIAQLWISQQRILGPVVQQTPRLTRLLLAWTLTIALLPFPTSLLADAGDEALTKILYIGLMALSSGLLAAVAWDVRRDPGLRDAAEPSDPVQSILPCLIFLLALAISLLWPASGYYPLLLLVLVGPVGGAVRRRRQQRVGQ